jgi:glutathione synthase/RimK-type ligase-like ATP-grasp enzyme
MISDQALLVVNHTREFPWTVPGAQVVSARDYLTGIANSDARRTQVINLCRYDRYQSRGYYVSLLAEARGQKPLPEMKSVGDLQGGHVGALAREPFATELQRWLLGCVQTEYTIDVVFGRDPAGRHDKLARAIFAEVPAPLLRVSFARGAGRWQAREVRVLSLADLSEAQRHLVPEAAAAYLHHARSRARESAREQLALAILYNADEPEPPSNPDALANFLRVARELGARAEIIGRRDIERLREFDGLFIRDTTGVNHYTYEFARRAADDGLVVIDEPESILRCTNKVFLHELLARHRISMPKTLMVHKSNVDAVVAELGLPCVLKQPDSAFSLGVYKAEDEAQLAIGLESLLSRSDLVLAQQWLPTAFDWRVGVLDRRPIYVCKYHMAPGHWQVVKREPQRKVEGSTTTITVGEAPEAVVRTAVRAANLIGDGLYGVDVKEAGGKCYVMEVNDNPNIDAGIEDALLKDALYRDIIGVFLRRIRERRGIAAP